MSADGIVRYRASKTDCDLCPLKPRCCPAGDARKVPRSVYEASRDLTRSLSREDEWLVSRRQRKKVEMLFAYLKRIQRLDRLRLQAHAVLAMSSISQQPRRTSVSLQNYFRYLSNRCQHESTGPCGPTLVQPSAPVSTDFFNNIGRKRKVSFGGSLGEKLTQLDQPIPVVLSINQIPMRSSVDRAPVTRKSYRWASRTLGSDA